VISDVLSDAINEMRDYQHEMPDSYADLGDEIGVVTTVMEALRICLDTPPVLSEEHGTLVEDLRLAIAKVDVREVQAARNRLLRFVQTLCGGSLDAEESKSAEWEPLGFVTIDTARMLLVDPVHTQQRFQDAGEEQIAIPGGDFSAVQVGTGIGDGRYRVEGRFMDSVFGRRLGEIRVRFLDERGSWLGSDEPSSESEA
jgi:hypothetical protein